MAGKKKATKKAKPEVDEDVVEMSAEDRKASKAAGRKAIDNGTFGEQFGQPKDDESEEDGTDEDDE